MSLPILQRGSLGPHAGTRGPQPEMGGDWVEIVGQTIGLCRLSSSRYHTAGQEGSVEKAPDLATDRVGLGGQATQTDGLSHSHFHPHSRAEGPSQQATRTVARPTGLFSATSAGRRPIAPCTAWYDRQSDYFHLISFRSRLDKETHIWPSCRFPRADKT